MNLGRVFTESEIVAAVMKGQDITRLLKGLTNAQVAEVADNLHAAEQAARKVTHERFEQTLTAEEEE
jgi:activator of 2-hydroxyglutaryl-CoA dehydratase